MPGKREAGQGWRGEDFGGGTAIKAASHGKEVVLAEAGGRRADDPCLADSPVMAVFSETALREVPVYDKKRRELRFQGKLVKRLRQGAKNVERILLEFDECGWEPSIDDPLPGPAYARADRLHNALKRLNARQKEGRIRLFLNGNGSTILWDGVEG